MSNVMESKNVIEMMLNGTMVETEMATVLREMALRDVSAQELGEMAKVMRSFLVRVPGHEDAIDTCGTGGSGLDRINTSTLCAFVLAAEGVKVAKHGNRSAGGRSGSFDVLEAVGCNIELGADQVARTLFELGLGFMYARQFHPAMKHVAGVRKTLGIRTVFNVLGPLTNPAFVKRQVLGVSDFDLAVKMIEVLKSLGHERALVVYGEDGLDEITLTGKTILFELKDGEVTRRNFNPSEVGLRKVAFDEISGGGVEENVRDLLAILKGEETGPKRDLVLVNAAAGFYVAGRVDDLQNGVELARESLESGNAYKLFEQYRDLTQSL